MLIGSPEYYAKKLEVGVGLLKNTNGLNLEEKVGILESLRQAAEKLYRKEVLPKRRVNPVLYGAYRAHLAGVRDEVEILQLQLQGQRGFRIFREILSDLGGLKTLHLPPSAEEKLKTYGISGIEPEALYDFERLTEVYRERST